MAEREEEVKRFEVEEAKSRLTMELKLDERTRDELIAYLQKTGKLKLGFDQIDELSLPKGFMDSVSIED